MKETGPRNRITQETRHSDSAPISRRRFLERTAAFSALLGAPIALPGLVPHGWVPVALAGTTIEITGKSGLTILNYRPLNAETPAPEPSRLSS